MIIKTTVSKTVQEIRFEPITISITIEKEIDNKDYKKEIKRIGHIARTDVKQSIVKWLESDD